MLLYKLYKLSNKKSLCQVFVGTFLRCKIPLVSGRPTLEIRINYGSFKYTANTLILFDLESYI